MTSTKHFSTFCTIFCCVTIYHWTLEEIDALAQTAYDIDFALPDSPPSPSVTASALADQITLVWGDEPESYNVVSEVDLDAAGNPTNFVFEGYNVYQHETASGGGAKKRLATYDIITVSYTHLTLPTKA